MQSEVEASSLNLHTNFKQLEVAGKSPCFLISIHFSESHASSWFTLCRSSSSINTHRLKYSHYSFLFIN